ncbi:MAG TPA: 2-phospho-L-lactate guanylyltransferase [Stellaceae bacterium]|jgi:2-phospho-L-lactate guanylyltransferase|nr:2-phospho-L-lactate guanylyltransferase [Stellaceae bacterium]
MSDPGEVWAVIPVKETQGAKQRLAPALSAPLRQKLALAMLEDVLEAVARVKGLGGAILVTVDPEAENLARRYGLRTLADGAHDGHTGAVSAGARHLVARGRRTLLTLPGDLPLITTAEIETLIAAHGPAPAFTIVPAHDDLGSNAILMSPPQAVPLRFGEDSYFPHLAAARAQGIEPCVVRLPGIAFDIDNPQDLHHFARLQTTTRAGRLIAEHTSEMRPE